jgi:hypothetical protein
MAFNRNKNSCSLTFAMIRDGKSYVSVPLTLALFDRMPTYRDIGVDMIGGEEL